MITVCYIALVAVALLSLWDSFLIEPVVDKLRGLVSPYPYAVYFLECHYCKGFWICAAGALIAGQPLLLFPSYGLLVVILHSIGIKQDGSNEEV